MKFVYATDPKTGDRIELRYENLHKVGAEVSTYRAGVSTGVCSLATADAEMAKMQAAHWTVECWWF
jgi:hypothetical protein